MTIKLTCRCQARIQAKDHLAGKRIKCPKCGEILSVPLPEPAPVPHRSVGQAVAASDPPAEETRAATSVAEAAPEKIACPSCNAALPAGAVFCVQCGYDLVQKKHLPNAAELPRCKYCGRALEPPHNLCPVCNVYELKKLERQTREPEVHGPYAQYRKATVSRLTRLWKQILDVKDDDEPQLKSLLAAWPEEISQCEPPSNLMTIDNLDESNRRLLQLLAAGSKRVAEVTQADLSPEVWGARRTEVVSRARSRVAGLCRVAKGLGKDRRLSNSMDVCLDIDGSEFHDWLQGKVESGEYSAAEVAEMDRETIQGDLRNHLGAALGGTARVLDIDDWKPTRGIHVQVHQWVLERNQYVNEGGLKSHMTIHYYDDEPDPGDTPEFEKKIVVNRKFSAHTSSDDVMKEWAVGVINHFPSTFQEARALAWTCINITCPNCGHPDLISDLEAPGFELCLRCGNDAITGQTQALLKESRETEDNMLAAGAGIGASVLLIVGYWLYVAFTSRFNVLAFSLVHVLGAIGMGLAIWAFKKARQESRWLGTKQVMSDREFKHPQAADENRRNLKTHAAAGA